MKMLSLFLFVLLKVYLFFFPQISLKSEPAVFMRYISYSIPMLIEIFLPCFYANQMTYASAKLSTSLFHSSWVNLDSNFKKAMKIFMENTKQPINYIALGLFKVNLETFTSISNFAYTLYAVLNSLNGQISHYTFSITVDLLNTNDSVPSRVSIRDYLFD